MGNEILYTVLVAIVGMLIVFAFLLLLSMLMIVTKRALGDREQDSATASDVSSLRTAPAGSSGGRREATSETGAPVGPPPWLFAAVVAFVFAEQEAHSAQPWIKGRKQ
jgi:Na+-transporting methylmalonyl-CoA/oxaloacetate decarboxylase gamma subunit